MNKSIYYQIKAIIHLLQQQDLVKELLINKKDKIYLILKLEKITVSFIFNIKYLDLVPIDILLILDIMMGKLFMEIVGLLHIYQRQVI